jgi:hypothetical protein
MIVVPSGEDLLLMTQPDHAALARRVMEHWRLGGLEAHPRRGSIMRAIECHDDGWLDVDAAPLVDDAGRVVDFVAAPAHVKQRVWPRAATRLSDDPWAAALVAEHGIYVYGRMRDDPEWAGFFEDMAAIRARHLAKSGLTIEDLRQDYAFVRLGDLMSLAFCNRWTDRHEAFGFVVGGEGRSVVVTPDPFAGEVVPLAVPARALPARAFADAAEAAARWHDAPRVELSGTARGA